jgi:hypothetical protein
VALIGFLIAELVVQWPAAAVVTTLAAFGPVVLAAASLSSAALNKPGSVIAFLPGSRD